MIKDIATGTSIGAVIAAIIVGSRRSFIDTSYFKAQQTEIAKELGG